MWVEIDFTDCRYPHSGLPRFLLPRVDDLDGGEYWQYDCVNRSYTSRATIPMPHEIRTSWSVVKLRDLL